MSDKPPRQRFEIDHSSVSESQVGGQVGGDLLQNQGSGNIFKDVIVNVFQSEPGEIGPGLIRQQYRNRQALLRKVEHYWLRGVLETSLRQQPLLHPPLELRPDLVLAPWSTVDQAQDQQRQTLAAGTQLFELFEQLGEGRSLLLLGDPGSGKTTLLLELTRCLVNRADHDANLRIPVVVNLASWGSKKQSMADWLIHELNSKYQVPRTVGQGWLQQQQLLLLLDGLDEVPLPRRDDCVDALNQFYQDYGPELVVVCRTQDYEALPNQLDFQLAVLTPDQVVTYLAAHPAIENLQQRIHHDKALMELANSPLMLQLICLTYDDIPSQPLAETISQRTSVFDAYIRQMFKRRSGPEYYSSQQTLSWLTWLAQQMLATSQAVFLIEELQPQQLPTPWQRALYRIGVRWGVFMLWGALHIGLLKGLLDAPVGVAFSWGLAGQGAFYGLVAGLVYGLLSGLGSSLVRRSLAGRLLGAGLLGIIFGLAFWQSWQNIWVGVAYGLLYGLVGLVVYGFIHQPIDPVETIRWSWRQASGKLILGVLVGLVLYFFTKDFVIPEQTGAIPLLLFSLMGLMIAMVFGFSRGQEVETAIVPNQGIWRSATNALRMGLAIGLPTGFFVGTLQGLHLSLTRGAAFGVVNGLIFGLLAAFIGAQGSGITCIKHGVLRILLWGYGYTPWNYARFLNYGCDRIFLHKVGGGYAFIHRALMEHFAQLQPSRP